MQIAMDNFNAVALFSNENLTVYFNLTSSVKRYQQSVA